MNSIGSILDRQSHIRNKLLYKRPRIGRVSQTRTVQTQLAQTPSDDAVQLRNLTKELREMNKELNKINRKIQILQKQNTRLHDSLLDAGDDEMEGYGIIRDKLNENGETIIRLESDKIGIRERIADINRELRQSKSVFSRILGWGNTRKNKRVSKMRRKTAIKNK
jgi:predicted transcriptional regulator